MLSNIIFALSTIACVSAAPIAPRSAELLPNTTQTDVDAVWYKMNGNRGACTKLDSDEDKVVGLPLEFYTDLSSVSPYCGQYVVVTNPNNNVSVTARVADASTLNNTLSLSVASWEALKDDSLHHVNWRRANETEVAIAKKFSTAPSSTATYVAPSHSAPASKEWTSPSSSSVEKPTSYSSSSAVHSPSTWSPSSSAVHSSSTNAPSSSSSEEEKKTYESSSAKSTSEWVAPSSTSTWTPPSSSSVAQNQRQAAPSSSSYVEEKKTSSTKAWVAPTTTYAPKTTTTSQYVAPKTTTQAQSSGGGGSYSGRATFYDQGGVAGSCGAVHSDSDYIVAMSQSFGSPNQYCGRSVHISYGGKSINAVVADTCPGCGSGSLDLSRGAFAALGSYDQGVLGINWSFN